MIITLPSFAKLSEGLVIKSLVDNKMHVRKPKGIAKSAHFQLSSPQDSGLLKVHVKHNHHHHHHHHHRSDPAHFKLGQKHSTPPVSAGA